MSALHCTQETCHRGQDMVVNYAAILMRLTTCDVIN